MNLSLGCHGRVGHFQKKMKNGIRLKKREKEQEQEGEKRSQQYQITHFTIPPIFH